MFKKILTSIAAFFLSVSMATAGVDVLDTDFRIIDTGTGLPISGALILGGLKILGQATSTLINPTSVSTTTLSGNAQISLSNPVVIYGNAPSGLSITANSIGDTQLAFDTGQALTTASSPTYVGLTLSGLGQGWVHTSGSVALVSSTSPTVNYITATSTNATSTYSFGVKALRLNTAATSTLAGLVIELGGLKISTLNCSAANQVIQTDSSGNIICGTDDDSAATVATSTATSVSDSNNKTLTAWCPVGYRASGGGGEITAGNAAALVINQSFPTASTSGWTTIFQEASAVAGVWTARTHVLCIKF